jgi:hypothetical protein
MWHINGKRKCQYAKEKLNTLNSVLCKNTLKGPLTEPIRRPSIPHIKYLKSTAFESSSVIEFYMSFKSQIPRNTISIFLVDIRICWTKQCFRRFSPRSVNIGVFVIVKSYVHNILERACASERRDFLKWIRASIIFTSYDVMIISRPIKHSIGAVGRLRRQRRG